MILKKISLEQVQELVEKLENLNSLLLEPKYSKYISLILDGDLKAISNENFLLVYDDELLMNEFNILLNDIENVLKEILNSNYKPIAVTNSEWEIIKNDYNKNKDKNKPRRNSGFLDCKYQNPRDAGQIFFGAIEFPTCFFENFLNRRFLSRANFKIYATVWFYPIFCICCDLFVCGKSVVFCI